MPTPRLLMDNDALLKAAHWNLLDVVPTLAGGAWADSACLPTFPPRVHRVESRLFADPEVAKALEAKLVLSTELPKPNPNVLDALQADPGIDAGELLLFGALAASPESVLLTGDKRALRAVACTSMKALFQHRGDSDAGFASRMRNGLRHGAQRRLGKQAIHRSLEIRTEFHG